MYLTYLKSNFFVSVGGYLSHSLAIMTDAAHLLSDFGGFMISLFALWLGTRKPSKKLSFGWHRAGENYVDILIQRSVSY